MDQISRPYQTFPSVAYEKTGVVEKVYFGSRGHALVGVAVLQRFKQKKNAYGMFAATKKKERKKKQPFQRGSRQWRLDFICKVKNTKRVTTFSLAETGTACTSTDDERKAIPLCLANNCKWNSQAREYTKTEEQRSSLYVVEEAIEKLREVKGT